ncbi:MAG TPA: LLM class flavin-dependent oxidoreductase, partial [Aggregatilineales bacterium]|nr:LLM class flavin-dependent oxidoreductase [Aggregatilineales bacterium]
IRAGMLDEALNIVVGLWSGEPFGYDGEHYQVAETQFLPRPIQQPRIPIWIAGHWNGKNKAAFRRAARWDGVFGLMRGQGQSPVEQFREMVAYVVQHRTSDAPFEIVYQGSATPGDDAARGAEIVAPFAEAGATWWLETISPARWGDDVDWQSEWNADALHERVCQPPPG